MTVAPGTFAPAQLSGIARIRTFDAVQFDRLMTEADAEDAPTTYGPSLGVGVIVTHPAGPGTYGVEVDADTYADMDAVLAGERPDMRRAVLASLGDLCLEHEVHIDRTDVQLLAALGLDVPACLLVTMLAHEIDPGCVDMNQFVAADGSGQTWLNVVKQNDGRLVIETSAASVGPGCFWSRGSLDVEGLPETVATALKRRPVTDLVRHPILDPLDLTVTDVLDSMECHVLRTDHRPKLARVADIAFLMGLGRDEVDAFRHV